MRRPSCQVPSARSFVLAQDADRPEAELRVGRDGASVGGVGIDREAVVALVVDEVASEGADRVEGHAGAVPLRCDRDVDARGAVVLLLLLAALDDRRPPGPRPR